MRTFLVMFTSVTFNACLGSLPGYWEFRSGGLRYKETHSRDEALKVQGGHQREAASFPRFLQARAEYVAS